MNIEKLFQVLVVGGALVGGQALANGTEFSSTKTRNFEDAELRPTFCTQHDACVKNADGKMVPKPGFTCCWGTTCEQKP